MIKKPSLAIQKLCMANINRKFHKKTLPEGVAQPPEGWSYVGQGVEGTALFKQGSMAIRQLDEGVGSPLSTNPKWRGKGWKQLGYRGGFAGLIPQAHYAIPDEAWKLLPWAKGHGPKKGES